MENVGYALKAIHSMSTSKLFLFSGEGLSISTPDGRIKTPPEMKYFTLLDEIGAVLLSVTIGLPFIARNPLNWFQKNAIVRQFVGPDGMNEYAARVSSLQE